MIFYHFSGPVCGKRFTASSNLYYHRMTHNKVRNKASVASLEIPALINSL